MAKQTTNKATPAFIKLVEQMRAAQKAYFKNRERADLMISKELEAKVARLEQVVAKMAHMAGASRIILESGLPVWEPVQKDMRKYKD